MALKQHDRIYNNLSKRLSDEMLKNHFYPSVINKQIDEKVNEQLPEELRKVSTALVGQIMNGDADLWMKLNIIDDPLQFINLDDDIQSPITNDLDENKDEEVEDAEMEYITPLQLKGIEKLKQFSKKRGD